jgi:hypothetical protein
MPPENYMPGPAPKKMTKEQFIDKVGSAFPGLYSAYKHGNLDLAQLLPLVATELFLNADFHSDFSRETRKAILHLKTKGYIEFTGDKA